MVSTWYQNASVMFEQYSKMLRSWRNDAYDTRTTISKHVLWSRDMSHHHKACCVITRHVSWSQDMSCNHNICLVITGHVMWSKYLVCDHKTCRVRWSRNMSCDHKICIVITRSVLWSSFWAHLRRCWVGGSGGRSPPGKQGRWGAQALKTMCKDMYTVSL